MLWPRDRSMAALPYLIKPGKLIGRKPHGLTFTLPNGDALVLRKVKVSL